MRLDGKLSQRLMLLKVQSKLLDCENLHFKVINQHEQHKGLPSRNSPKVLRGLSQTANSRKDFSLCQIVSRVGGQR